MSWVDSIWGGKPAFMVIWLWCGLCTWDSGGEGGLWDFLRMEFRRPIIGRESIMPLTDFGIDGVRELNMLFRYDLFVSGSATQGES